LTGVYSAYNGLATSSITLFMNCCWRYAGHLSVVCACRISWRCSTPRACACASLPYHNISSMVVCALAPACVAARSRFYQTFSTAAYPQHSPPVPHTCTHTAPRPRTALAVRLRLLGVSTLATHALLRGLPHALRTRTRLRTRTFTRIRGLAPAFAARRAVLPGRVRHGT